MHIRAYFSNLKLGNAGALSEAMVQRILGQSVDVLSGAPTITVSGTTRTVVVENGEIYKAIQREDQLPTWIWNMVDYVSVRDQVSDPAMVNQMVSGEYERPDGTKATVRIGYEGQGEGAYLCATIEITSPTWMSAMILHRAILFGQLPDMSYAPAAK